MDLNGTKYNKIIEDDLNESVGTMYFTHMYWHNALTGKQGEHACLDMGYWCWQHARENPKKAIRYIRHIGNYKHEWKAIDKLSNPSLNDRLLKKFKLKKEVH